MSFPAGVQTVTVNPPVNGYRTLDGSYQQGTITLTPTVPEVVSAEHGIIAVGAVQFTLGASGSFMPRTVLPNDAEGFTPTGWTYRLDQQLTGETPRSYNVLIPASAGSVDLSTLVEVTATDGVVVSVPGGHGTPSDTVTAETNYGQAASAGVSTDYSRGDHTHGSPAAPTVGTTAGTYAAGDDSRIVGAVQKAQNLADLASAATARTNLGLGSAATQNTSAFDAAGAAATAQANAGSYTDGRIAAEVTRADSAYDHAGAAASAQAAAIADAAGKYRLRQPWVFDITDAAYGAVGDARIVTDGAVNVGVATLTCATSQPFASGDVGKSVLVQGAGTFGVTAWATTIAGYNGPGSVALAGTPPTSISGAIVVFGTNNYTAIRAATAAAEAYLASGHPHAEVFTPSVGGFVIDGPLDTSKSGNGQIPFGVYPTTAGKKSLAFRGGGPGAGVRHWEQTVPQVSGSTWISFGFYSSTSAQLTDLNANGNPGVISGPNEGTSNGLAYGASARYSNVMPVLEDMAILTPHTAYGITWGGWNFFGCANAVVKDVSLSTLGTVPSSTDYTSPGTFGTGLSVGCLMPAPGNNDLSLVDNLSIQGGYTYGIFFSEHTLIDRIMVLYCWAALCPVGSYAGSVGSVHEMRVLSASVEACTHEVYIVGVGSQGVGPTVDIHLSTESSTPNIAGNSQAAVNSALGRIKLTGLFSEGGVSTQYPTGIEVVDGQVPRAIKRKTANFTVSPIDRVFVCDTTSGAFTGTLPDASYCPTEYTFRSIGANPLTVATTSGQLIYSSSGAGSGTFTLPAGQTLRVQALYNGSSWGWYALQRDALPTTGGTVSGDLTVSGRLSGPVAPYGVIAPSRTGPAWRKASISHIFQSGHGWTAAGAASSNLNNAAGDGVRGTQYASITTDTASTPANLRKFGMSAMDLTGKMLRLICRASDVSKISDISFFVGTSSLANNFKWRLWEVSGASQLGSSGEWITLTFGWSSLNSASGSYTISSTGMPSTTSGFTDFEVQVTATSGNAVTLDVQAVEVVDGTTTTFPNGVVSIVFDDGADSIWNYARPAMDTYGFQGTNYVIVNNLGVASYMTSTQSRQLQDFSGWEIGLHSYDATMHNNRYTTYTAQQVDDDIRKGKQWLVQNGFRGEGIAYPGGEYQTTTDGVGIDSIASRYFGTGRTILFQAGFPTETFPAGMPMRVRAVSSISSTQAGANNPSNLVAAGGLLDKCQLAGGWLILVFHKITAGAATVATECSQSDFQLIMAGINSRGIPVVPVSDVHRLYS